MSGGGASAALRAAACNGDLAACIAHLDGLRCVRYTKDEHGRTALHLAAAGGHEPVVRLLLDAAANGEIDATDAGGATALQCAAAAGHESIVKLLLARGADVDRQDGIHGNAALHESAWKGYSRCVRLLCAAGAALSRPNAGGFTPLHLACQNGHNQACRELLLAGADADVQNNYGDTALHTAARYGHAGVTRILISARCRISVPNKNGDTALHIAAAMGRRKLTRILLEAGCERRMRNKQNESARDIASRKCLDEILAILDGTPRHVPDDPQKKERKRSKSKVRFDATDGAKRDKQSHWSPYGCHYYPDPEAFPSPRLDSLPTEPLKRGEQYYLDLAGNICKGPVGVGYTCYCAPLFRHLEARLERDKKELEKAQLRLGQRVAGIEQRLNRRSHGRRSERLPQDKQSQNENRALQELVRSRSLEMLGGSDAMQGQMQLAKSLDELDPDEKPSAPSGGRNEQSESSDGDQKHGTAYVVRYENVAHARSRSGLYSPAMPPPDGAMIDSNALYRQPTIEPMQFYQPTPMQPLTPILPPPPLQSPPPPTLQQQQQPIQSQQQYIDMNSRFARLRLLDGRKTDTPKVNQALVFDPKKVLLAKGGVRMMIDGAAGCSGQSRDVIDQDTNNDSGYSTKLCGSSKGNSPSLSGQLDGAHDCLGASSLV